MWCNEGLGGVGAVGAVDACQKMWVGLTMMKQNVCHLSMSVQGWGGMSS